MSIAFRGSESSLAPRRRALQSTLRAAAAAAGLLVSGGIAFTGNAGFGSGSSSSSRSTGAACFGRPRLTELASPPGADRPLAWRGSRQRPPWVRSVAAATETQQDVREKAAEAHLERLRALAERGLSDEAEDTLYSMIDAGGKPEAAHFGSVIESCAPSVDVERAERWLFRMKALHVEPDREVYNALMHVAAEAGSPENVDSWMKESWKEGHEPDLASFLLMLKALRKASDSANAESWFERLMEYGLQPDINCVNEIIGIFAEKQDFTKVAEWFAITRQSLGLAPDEETYRLIMSAYVDIGEIEEAERLFEEMVQEGLRPGANIYTLFTGDGKSDRSLETVEKWAARLLGDNVEMDSDAYTAVIGAWAAAGSAQHAEDWYAKMVENDMATAEALALLVDSLVLTTEDGEELAEEWISQLKESGKEVTPSVYAARASADVHSGDFEQVEARMQAMEMEGLTMEEDCLTVMLLAYANAQPQQSLLAEQMFKQQMLRGKTKATKEVLEALRAAVGGARCLALRRELEIGTSEKTSPFEAVDFGTKSAAQKRMYPRPRRQWKRFLPPEPPVPSLKWE